MINARGNLILFFFLIYSSNLFACLSPIVAPYPDPNGKFNWRADDKVVFGTVSSVEKNLNMTWFERKLIDFKVMSDFNDGGLTPLHKVELKDVHYYIGTGTNPTSFELHGCGLAIPKLGLRAIFFISGKGEDQKIVPLYESNYDAFKRWLTILEKNNAAKQTKQ